MREPGRTRRGADQSDPGGMKRRHGADRSQPGAVLVDWTCDDLFAALHGPTRIIIPTAWPPARRRAAWRAARRWAEPSVTPSRAHGCRSNKNFTARRLHFRRRAERSGTSRLSSIEQCVVFSLSTTTSRSPGGGFLNQFVSLVRKNYVRGAPFAISRLASSSLDRLYEQGASAARIG